MTTTHMQAVRALNEFLRHLHDRDLPDAELFEVKAHAFDLMADQFEEDGNTVDAAESRAAAARARARTGGAS